ncbi:hypothetical protein DDSR119_75 [Pseudomonas phage DDSR119]|nr:hypothetical protein DDSR119_75 [Pseudomonas phage DDSR119]
MSDIPKSADTIYTQRAALAVAVARLILAQGGTAGIKPANIEAGEWAILYIELPDGAQLSYHISQEDDGLLAGLPLYKGEWDGTFLGRGAEWLSAIPIPTEFERIFTVPMAEKLAYSRLKGTALSRWQIERKKLAADPDVLPEVAAAILMGYARKW